MATSSSEQLWSDRTLAVTVEDADGARRTLRVAKPYARLGSHDRAEVVLTGADISPCHLYLHATDEGIYCLSLAGSASTGWLGAERSIKIGRYRISAAFDGEGPPPRATEHNSAAKDSIAAPLPRLRVRLTGDKKHAFELNLRRQLTVMGRQAPSTLCVHHSTVSRTHAVLFWDGQSLWVVDLLGANGIRRDGEPLDAGLLAPSQRIALGDVRCRYLGARVSKVEVGEAEESGDESRDAETVATDRDAELTEVAHEIERLRQELAAASSAREIAEGTAADYQRQLDELAADHAALQADAEAVRRELAASQEAIVVHQTAGEQRIADLREALRDELNSVSTARELAERAAAERATALAEAQEDLLRLPAELKALTGARDPAETETVSRLEAELAEARQSLAASQLEQSNLRTAADERLAALREQLTRDVASAMAAREAAERLAAEREWAVDEATETVSRLEAELAVARQLLEVGQQEQTSLRSAADERIAALREQLAHDVGSAIAAREAAEQLAAERDRALCEATESASRLNAELSEARQLLAASKNEQATILATADKQIAALREQLTRDIASAEAAREAAERVAAERDRALCEATENVSRLNAEISEARELLAASKNEQATILASADKQIAVLSEQLTRDVASAKAAREAAERVAADRERAVAETTKNVARLEEASAASQRELASVRDDFAALQSNADESLAALRQSHQREIERVTAALQASANECLAALEESLRQEIADLEDERDQNRQTSLASQAELADARKIIEQLQAELAATRGELFASRKDEVVVERDALPDEQLEATPAASLPTAEPVAAALELTPPAAAEPEPDALPTAEDQWVLDDRVIGRLLDFRAKRESGRRRKLLWAAAACLAIVCLGAAAAAGRAWSARRQPSDAPAASTNDVDKLIREALIEPGLR
ncbi:MAG TPA: FHA domain-containing protein [Pirellulales bacterium]|nr:FHA domain-containing protein [Pirellulales bacterium]